MYYMAFNCLHFLLRANMRRYTVFLKCHTSIQTYTASACQQTYSIQALSESGLIGVGRIGTGIGIQCLTWYDYCIR